MILLLTISFGVFSFNLGDKRFHNTCYWDCSETYGDDYITTKYDFTTSCHNFIEVYITGYDDSEGCPYFDNYKLHDYCFNKCK